VKIRLGDYNYQVCGYDSEKEMPVKIWYYYDSNLTLKSYIDVYLTDYRPYLRPMSSMTEEEKEELRQEQIKDEQLFADCIKNHPEMRGLIIPHFAADWCNKNMFDYRGLIEEGLALEAPEEMYGREEQK
jgi:hypothetical protein